MIFALFQEQNHIPSLLFLTSITLGIRPKDHWSSEPSVGLTGGASLVSSLHTRPTLFSVETLTGPPVASPAHSRALASFVSQSLQDVYSSSKCQFLESLTWLSYVERHVLLFHLVSVLCASSSIPSVCSCFTCSTHHNVSPAVSPPSPLC